MTVLNNRNGLISERQFCSEVIVPAKTLVNWILIMILGYNEIELKETGVGEIG